MKKVAIAALCAVTLTAANAQVWTTESTKALVERVNAKWQEQNGFNHWAFWDYAAYHTGNMEAYKLTGNEKFLEFSRQWANHNKWMGGTEPDKSKWIYKKYGETMQHVLFGDWLTCFQTYIDIANFDAKAGRGTQADWDAMTARPREVMGHMLTMKECDFWFWADALYMVMPVMTKLYKLTGDEAYLDKLYANLLFCDSIMYDNETGLYFRDGKYVYPKHKTANGKRDYWARGDGWVLAGLAKVLADMPKSHKHRKFFQDKFVRMANAVRDCQQKEGYWTRSMIDPEQAPGPETSGTAFFTYGILWGVNNGILPAREFRKCIDRAWNYLTTMALQPDNTVGYVQPIGERAIPGQKVNKTSQAPFGTGAFLLAACEYANYVK